MTFEYFASAHNEYIKMLNNVHEYVFGSEMYINITKYNNDLPKYLLGIHEEIAMRSKELKQDKFLIPNNIYGIYYSLYEKSICGINEMHILNEYFPLLDNQSCNELFYNSTLYGLRILVTTFINEILGIKNMLNSLIIKQQTKGFIYNMSLYGTENEKSFVPDNETEPETFNEYFELHPMTLFNSKNNYVVKKIYQTILINNIAKLYLYSA